MDSFILALNVVFPLFFMMALGYGIKILRIIDGHSVDNLNKIVYRIFMPILLFNSIYNTKLQALNMMETINLLVFVIIAILFICGISIFIFTKTITDISKRSVMIQGMFRSNFVIFGIPIASAIAGNEITLSSVSTLVACIVPLYNVLAVIVFEYYRGEKIEFKRILLGVLKNPLVVAATIGYTLLILNHHLPGILIKSIGDISKASTPLAFIVLGATFRFSELNKNKIYLVTIAVGKLILIPTIIFCIAYYLGFSKESMTAIFGIAATPVAVSSFTMAKEMGGDGELACQLVVLTSILSIFTIFLWVLCLNLIQIV